MTEDRMGLMTLLEPILVFTVPARVKVKEKSIGVVFRTCQLLVVVGAEARA